MDLQLAIIILVGISSAALGKGTKVGDFVKHQNEIAGTVYAVDESTLSVNEFTYDGAGTDVHFVVGADGKPSGEGTILTFLFEGKESTSLISAFDAEDIVLTLPTNLKVTELAWLSVWSGESGINFGELIFPEKIEIISESEEAPTSEPVVQKKSENSNGLESEASPSLKQTDADNDISSIQQHHQHLLEVKSGIVDWLEL